MIATGAGAESRQAIGSAVFFGTIVSLALTLFVVPALYALLARNTRSPHYVSDLIDRLTSRSAALAGGAVPVATAGPAGGAADPASIAVPPAALGGQPPGSPAG
jgi:hypothetical protein